MRWTIKEKPDEKTVIDLQKSLGVSTVIARLLVQRGITNFNEAKRFFRPSLKKIHHPYLMKDMKKAVARIEKAVSKEEKILIYGDYDVDGTTSVALLYSYLTTFYKNVSTYIPDRYEEGYGVSYQGIDYAHKNNFTLIIALDCGIKAIDKVAYATKKGIDFIICDHHLPSKEIPKAIAVLDPKRLDCNYPYKELCGCGVGFKLIHALAINKNQTIEDLLPYLDLVATAIAADIVPITGENRILAYYGLQVINAKPRIGIRAILNQVKKETLTITDVVFIIAPRINAAGRIKHGNAAVELLIENDLEKAISFAQEIESYNLERKQLDQAITEEALQQIQENKEEENVATVVYAENWHKGVIGIVASRLIETYYRPTLVFTKSGTKLSASARSVKGFDIYKALEQCSDLIEQFGGHKYAAGLTITPENYKSFKHKFEQVVTATLPNRLKAPEIVIDSEIIFSEITPKFYRILKQFAPFGPQNMAPVFIAFGLQDNGYGKKVGVNEDHLKLSIFQGIEQKTFNAIGFNLGNKDVIATSKKLFKAAFTIGENTWNNYTSLQLVLKDIKEE